MIEQPPYNALLRQIIPGVAAYSTPIYYALLTHQSLAVAWISSHHLKIPLLILSRSPPF
jgi:hypothetical protein